jgi:hypothetical protein
VKVFALDETSNAAGALVYWRLEGEVDPKELALHWQLAGLDDDLLPSTPAPSTALARTMRGLAAHRKLVRPLEERGSHALVREVVSGNDLTYDVALRVSLDVAGRAIVEPAGHPLQAQIHAAYDHHLEVCAADDIGGWLVGLIAEVDGVAMRERGGIYFVPPAKLPLWQAMTTALRKVSNHRMFELPAVAAGTAVEAILDAISQEAEADATKMEAELLSDELGGRALASRVSKTEALEAKVTRYEGLLGAKLDVLRDRLEALRANLTVAILKSQPAESMT